jgi:UDP-N-acetylglucosamine--N-acetylmuramyl-(pentapeptide) pyrophosphoryl-undecaprenol N-acetylglucosamine transferase
MKILFAGGGTGGHFYPIIAVIEALQEVMDTNHLVGIKFFFMSDKPIDPDLLARMDITYIQVKTGKRRTYSSFRNFIDLFRTFGACLVATWKMFVVYPDVVFGKGGYASFPALFAARLLRIPVVIHESDIVPGRVNRWVANYATKIAISYPEAVDQFAHKDRVALTGQPVRKALREIPVEDPWETFQLEQDIPTILVLGGSQGSERINENIIDVLPQLLQKYQVIHQTGEANLLWMKKRAAGVLARDPVASRYRPYGFLDAKHLSIAAKASSLIISRAGSVIFEIAIWGKPSILIPLAIARNDHQKKNAYSFARAGAAMVIEEQNLKPALLISVIESVMANDARRHTMEESARSFTKTDAAEKIATALLSIVTHHD